MKIFTAGGPARLLLLGLVALAGLTAAKAARAQPAPLGWWLDQSGGAAILVAPCGGQICGNIEWLKTPLNPQGQRKTDTHNPNPALRRLLLCGLPMVGNFMPAGAGSWAGGWVYDPQGGKTYQSEMRLRPDGRLSVRGYIGIPLFGRSTVWTRPAGPKLPCDAG